MESQYPHVVRAIAEQPWALLPDKLATMLDVIRFRHAGGSLSGEEIRAVLGTPGKHGDVALFDLETEALYHAGADEVFRSATGGTIENRPGGRPVVAVLGVYGIISQRADMFTEMSGGTSTERLAARFRSAMADQAVKGIVLDVDSPGGGVYGVQELADEIRAARGQKPVVAVANSLSASAAYWIGTAAEELSVTPSGEVGSVGVYAAHEDVSKALETEGVKVTLVSAGRFKTEGNPFEPLSEEARAYMQTRVSDYYDAFVKAVAKGRGVSPDDVRKGFGQGRVVGAKQAVAERMADRVETLDDAVRRVAGRRRQPEAPAAAVAQPNHYAEAERDAALSRVRVQQA
jgi:signal peptide peptidase SppA